MYKQAGNSIVVDVMLAVLRQIIKTGVFDTTANLCIEKNEIDEVSFEQLNLELNYDLSIS